MTALKHGKRKLCKKLFQYSRRLRFASELSISTDLVLMLVYRELVSASVASTLLTLTHSVRAQLAHCDSTRSRCAAQARVMVYYEMRKEK